MVWAGRQAWKKGVEWAEGIRNQIKPTQSKEKYNKREEKGNGHSSEKQSGGQGRFQMSGQIVLDKLALKAFLLTQTRTQKWAAFHWNTEILALVYFPHITPYILTDL